MTNKHETPYAALRRVFHEPSRMAIVTALCAHQKGLSFGDLKKGCTLTDGNLNRHLKTLADAQAVRVKKVSHGTREYTMVRMTENGKEHFLDYLKTLEDVLRHTSIALAEERVEKPAMLWQTSAWAD